MYFIFIFTCVSEFPAHKSEDLFKVHTVTKAQSCGFIPLGSERLRLLPFPSFISRCRLWNCCWAPGQISGLLGLSPLLSPVSQTQCTTGTPKLGPVQSRPFLHRKDFQPWISEGRPGSECVGTEEGWFQSLQGSSLRLTQFLPCPLASKDTSIWECFSSPQSSFFFPGVGILPSTSSTSP